MQNEIARSAYEYQKKIEMNEKIIVGVNKFQLKQEDKIPLLKLMTASGKYKLKNLNA